ncbi:LADA_0G07470g1_1 [Lachancea dasiensis]|uniref:serine--tRNA ligase n=1 Tax=Lachancea dasiensis TaxID=1072105 RepID=A0A1G4JTZ7_9SACH|nr:LADA_0G07470g1_1 [Lachancea dasiensis]
MLLIVKPYTCVKTDLERTIDTMVARYLSTSAVRPLRRAQFDVKAIVSQVSQHAEAIHARQLVSGGQLIAQLNALPLQNQEAKHLDTQIAGVQTRRKAIERQIKQDKTHMHQLKGELVDLKNAFKRLNLDLTSVRDSIHETCLSLPNLVGKDVPLTAPQEVCSINPMPKYVADPQRDHHDIMVRKNLVDFKSAATVSGNSWYYLVNDGALLEQALVSYATKRARQHGFSMCHPPSIAKNEVIDACGFRPRDMNNEQQIYHLAEGELGLTATAEISLAGMQIDSVLELPRGVKKLCGVSRSYRAEAGARGKDTRGLYRVHEFTKVELFCWAHPDESGQVLQDLLELQMKLVSELGLSAKVLNMPANDLGAPAFRKYDIEAWMPGRGAFGEITSASNCTDFQSRRMGTRFRDPATGKTAFVHTLNGTAMAVPRIMVAIVENFYDPATGMVKIPEPLVPYMDDKTHI